MATYQPSSPCQFFCHMDEARGVCLACFRTAEEIGKWTFYNDKQRWEIIGRANERQMEFLNINQQFFYREACDYDA